jgi:hypothetical protein
MPALVAGIHVSFAENETVDGRNKSGHDDKGVNALEKPC